MSGVLLLAGMLLFALTFLPPKINETTILLNQIQAGDATGDLSQRSVQFRVPESLPSSQETMLEMTLLPPAGASTAVGGAPTLVEGRLDLPGVEVSPAAALTTPYLPGQTVSFRWMVKAGNDMPLPGRLWLTVISSDTRKNETRTPILAHPLELDIQRLLGLPLPQARLAGGGSMAAGLLVLASRLIPHPRLKKQKARPKKSAQIS